jgi:O-antigen/teichoic acid export membrane protein
MLVLSGLAFAFGFVTNVVLGRSGPEVLGFYGFVVVTLSLLSGFFVLGGNHVVMTYLPAMHDSERTSFLRTYALIIVAFAVVLLGVCVRFPSILRALYGGGLSNQPLLLYLALLLPVSIAQMLSWSVLQSDLRLRRLALSQQTVSVLTCVSLVLAVLVAPAFGMEDPLQSRSYVLVAVLVANLASLGVALWPFTRRRTGGRAGGTRPARAGPSLPAGFWRFSIAFHASTVLFFVIRNADQLFVLHRLGLAELGFYRSAFVVAQLVAWFASVTDWAVYPALCNLAPVDRPAAYVRFARLNSVGTAVIAAGIILLSRLVLDVFGRSVSAESRTLLLVLAAANAVTAPLVTLNNSAIMARGRAGLVFVENLGCAAAAIAAYWLLGSRFGLLGVAAAFAALQGLLLVVSTVLAARVLPPPFPFPLRASATSVVAVLYALAGDRLLPWSVAGLSVRVVLLGLLPLGLFVSRLVGRDELTELRRLLLPHGASPRSARRAAEAVRRVSP